MTLNRCRISISNSTISRSAQRSVAIARAKGLPGNTTTASSARPNSHIAPLTFDAPAGGPFAYGLGDTELRFKYRFIDEDKNGARPMIGVYPLIELPIGDEARSLGAGYVRTYFPLWLQKSFGNEPPMAAVATGSIRVTTPLTAITGSSAGSYKSK